MGLISLQRSRHRPLIGPFPKILQCKAFAEGTAGSVFLSRSSWGLCGCEDSEDDGGDFLSLLHRDESHTRMRKEEPSLWLLFTVNILLSLYLSFLLSFFFSRSTLVLKVQVETWCSRWRTLQTFNHALFLVMFVRVWSHHVFHFTHSSVFRRTHTQFMCLWVDLLHTSSLLQWRAEELPVILPAHKEQWHEMSSGDTIPTLPTDTKPIYKSIKNSSYELL